MGFVGIFVHQLLQSVGLTMTTAVQTGWLWLTSPKTAPPPSQP